MYITLYIITIYVMYITMYNINVMGSVKWRVLTTAPIITDN